MLCQLDAQLQKHIEPVTESGCWIWTAYTDKSGYPYASWHRHTRRAHRLIYELLVGPIPQGLQLDHICRVRGCVNPAHLEPVTAKINTLRGQGPTSLNAVKTYCKNGHSFNGESLRLDPRGGRFCRECQKLRSRVYYHRDIEKQRERLRVKYARKKLLAWRQGGQP